MGRKTKTYESKSLCSMVQHERSAGWEDPDVGYGVWTQYLDFHEL